MKERIKIESNHVTRENQREFGMEHVQFEMLNQLLYKSTDVIHGYVLDCLGKDGLYNMQFKLTRPNAELLIKTLFQIIDKEIDVTQYDKELPFQFIEYDTPEWHIWKNNKRLNKLLNLNNE